MMVEPASSSLLVRLHARLWRRRRVVLGAWLLAAFVAAPFAAVQTKHLSGGGFNNLGSDSARVAHALTSGRFPGVQANPLALILVPRAGAPRGALHLAISSVEHKLLRVGGVGVQAAQLHAAQASASAHPTRPVLIQLSFRGGESYAIDLATTLRHDLGIAGQSSGTTAGGSVEVNLAGQGALWAAFRDLANTSAQQAEARGFPIIAIVLLAVFGSLAAAALPLSLGAAAVIITGAIIYALSLLTEMSVFVTNIASMIGIGVAVDYSLFVLVRYREEIAAGQTPERARATAMSTSGRAVVLAGFTVIASLAALFLIPSNGIRSMATGAIIVVAISVLAAATLLPVVIGMLGSRPYEIGRIGRLLQRLRISRRRAPMRQGFWQRWSAAVMRHPVVALLAATTFMLLLAAPALDLKVRNSASTQLNRGNEVTRASSEVAQLLGPGALGPVWVLLESRRGPTGPHAEQTVLRVAQTLASDPLVARVIAAQPSRNRRAVVLEATLRVNPESQRAFSAIERLRKRLPASAGSGVIVRVGGTTAELLDFDRLVTVSLWRPVLFVLLLSFVILLILLRSVVLPLKAMLMNSLSVAAAYGALVAVFQFGWLGFLGLHKASSIYPITLPLVIVVAFGLSMDYHVFLLSRIRERYFATGDSDRAVSEALASSATPITSAALIMVAVFLSFVGAGVPSVEQLGFAAAVAITVDATIVRLVIVPAAMKLLGRWNWWLPHALDSRLPGGLGRTVPRIGVPRGSELAGSELAVSTLSASSGD